MGQGEWQQQKTPPRRGWPLHPATFCWGGQSELIPAKDAAGGSINKVCCKNSKAPTNGNTTKNEQHKANHGHSSSLRQQGPQ